MKPDTLLAHLGRKSADALHAVNPPLVRASTTVFTSLAEFRRAQQAPAFTAPSYGRAGTATTFELQEAMAALARTESCIATTNGLNAITAVLSAHADPGRQLLVYDGVYGPARAFCEKQLRPRNVRIDYFEKADELPALLSEQTALIYLEAPSSLTMRMLDVRRICALARPAGIPVACDATWGTPVYFDAHGLGVDLAVHAATKYINGHSDVMLGLITGRHGAMESVRAWCAQYGAHAAPDACWLTLRGLRTLGVRLQRHQASALITARWLRDQSQVKAVYFPALPEDPGHELWRSQFSGGPGPFTIELQPCAPAAFEKFVEALRLFNIGVSWGGFESLVLPIDPRYIHARNAPAADCRLVRLHIGLEDPEDLCADLQQALAQI